MRVEAARDEDRQALRRVHLRRSIAERIDESSVVVVRSADDAGVSAATIGYAALSNFTLAIRPESLLALVQPAISPGRGDDTNGAPPLGHAATRALIDAMVDAARARGASGVANWIGLARHTDDAAPWRDAGFEIRPKLVYYDADAQTFAAWTDEVCNRLAARGRLPVDDYELVRLDEAPLDEVLALRLSEIGGDPGRLAERLRGRGAEPFRRDLSWVALWRGRVAGFMLIRIGREGWPLLESRIVARWARGVWVNPMLMRVTVMTGLKEGYTRFQFRAGDQHATTRRLAERFAPPTVVLKESFVRRL